MGDLAERVAGHGGLGVRLVTAQGETERSALAAGRDRDLWIRQGLPVGELRVGRLQHHGLRIELQLETEPLRQFAPAKLTFLAHPEPAVVERIVDLELVGARLHVQPEITALEQGPIVQQTEQTLHPPRLLVELGVAAGHADGQHRQGNDHRHDHHDHENFDQRKALVAHEAPPARYR
jgi:hypothetical protein